MNIGINIGCHAGMTSAALVGANARLAKGVRTTQHCEFTKADHFLAEARREAYIRTCDTVRPPKQA